MKFKIEESENKGVYELLKINKDNFLISIHKEEDEEIGRPKCDFCGKAVKSGDIMVVIEKAEDDAYWFHLEDFDRWINDFKNVVKKAQQIFIENEI